MVPDYSPVQPSSWQTDHPWLTELTFASASEAEDNMDETTRYALDEMRIA